MSVATVPVPGLKPLDELENRIPGHAAMEVLDGTGDSKFQWDPEKPAELAAAKEMFNNLKAKGYDGFYTDAKGKPGDRMLEFDPRAGQMIMTGRMVGG